LVKNYLIREVIAKVFNNGIASLRSQRQFAPLQSLPERSDEAIAIKLTFAIGSRN